MDADDGYDEELHTHQYVNHEYEIKDGKPQVREFRTATEK